jgi:hypothetical protein
MRSIVPLLLPLRCSQTLTSSINTLLVFRCFIEQMPAYASQPFPAFAAMKDVRWSAWPPGARVSRVEFAAKLVQGKRARFGIVHASAAADGRHVVCEAELWFSFLPAPATTAGNE